MSTQQLGNGPGLSDVPIKLRLPLGRKAVAMAVRESTILIITTKDNKTDIFGIGDNGYSTYPKLRA